MPFFSQAVAASKSVQALTLLTTNLIYEYAPTGISGSTWSPTSNGSVTTQNLTAVGASATTSDGVSCYSFDGVNDYVYGMPNYSLLNGGDKVTVCMWIKKTSIDQYDIHFEADGLVRSQTMALDANGGYENFLAYKANTSATMTYGGSFYVQTLPLSYWENWGFWVFRIDMSDGSQYKPSLYYNGTYVGITYGENNTGSTWSGISADGSTNHKIGTTAGLNYDMTGHCGYISGYRDYLTPTQIQSIYNFTKNQYGFP